MEKFLTEGHVVNVLKNKDHLGRRIMVVNCGKVWDPDVCPGDQVFRLFYLSWLKCLCNLVCDLIFLLIFYHNSLQFTSYLNLRNQLRSTVPLSWWTLMGSRWNKLKLSRRPTPNASWHSFKTQCRFVYEKFTSLNSHLFSIWFGNCSSHLSKRSSKTGYVTVCEIDWLFLGMHNSIIWQ